MQCAINVGRVFDLKSLRYEFFLIDTNGEVIVIHDQDRFLFGWGENSLHYIMNRSLAEFGRIG